MPKRRVLLIFMLLLAFSSLLIFVQVMRFGTLSGFAYYDGDDSVLSDVFNGKEEYGILSARAAGDVLHVAEIDPISVSRGESEFVSVNVFNLGEDVLNSCAVSLYGINLNWVYSNQVKDLTPGTGTEFVFSVEIPKDAETGKHDFEVITRCEEVEKRNEFSLEVLRNDFEIRILNIERISGELRMEYLVEEFVGKERNIDLTYDFLNSEDVKIVSGKDSLYLGANELIRGFIEFDLPKDSYGEFDIIIEANDGAFSSVSENEILLGKAGTTGLSVASDADDSLSIYGIFFVFLLIIYFIVKFFRRQTYNADFKGKHQIPIDLENS